ncbi:U3 small nucleolar RNA-associated protein [Aureococcus anophagefferens]|jgi:U3 small nucleolar RNA-associated protein 11|uniref:U3 small nucleolar RNA-associated protein 11 n=1 Tax=Aureococcus anophagefferens TaxID=44056 RepID=A0ABR1FT09_AURAN|mmetsp:Transcript_13095/g.42217  ORF Transcript_13095/g.42217 Transcript_13095/m.42217 type:complete len:227 (-) Transcript_13095:679-1359(-)
MSSLRNAVKRKTHKERSQPAARKHLGLLEKHSDYKLRADNYHKKQERIKTLSRKASERNEDEFYFAMTKTVAGEAAGPEGSSATHEAISGLKAQDLRYAHMRKVVDDRKVEKLRASLHATETASSRGRHTYFDDGEAGGDVEARALAKATATKPKPDKAARVASKKVARAYATLDDALEKQRVSTKLLQRLEAEKHVLNAKGRKRKVAAGDKGKAAVFKWKKQRQK